ncbi:Diguanylate cyclase/phosphodiesterase (GGDEF & EAL domains) with PAS/PAC sensor [Alteromonas sp. 38]|uniref:putative bifunctional diguanylate cyclase/phosphodiesterase n=1 Tax=unclassified Alteromonas TaxID=2614992 RepID=UPI0012F1C6B7|nr:MULTISPECIES: EAL domain-containing protein [unclassified Alteromonas]CAD5265085.1 Diguanylate cyclase/phosphodiesterase (GGDEF & EAL domains) with PAS/PAC sensor [Alteromonas sp. 154]VXC12918.1 Diguanylate cyclase/phosphodiesterase (GGDEF & EAL domains) with PAS/PAC sensor [Alteromonas sp. 38]
MKSFDENRDLTSSLPITPQMQRDLADMLNRNMFTGLAMTFFAFLGLTFGFGFDTEKDQSSKVLLFIAMNTVIVLRFADGLYWLTRLKGTQYDARPVKFRFAIGVYSTSTVWALYSILLYTTMNAVELATTMVILGAMAGGAASVLAPSKIFVFVYTTSLLVPMSSRALLDDDRNFVVLGILGLIFWVGILASSFRYHRFFFDTVSLKNKNARLIEQMRTDRQETAKINAMLRKSNEQLDDANANLEDEVEKRTADIFRLSNRDPLTNLLNRNGLFKQLNTLIESTKALDNNLAVLFIDLDGFKQVNDSLGHKVGDIVLAEIANRLAQYCEKDHLARWGGDEFVAVTPYATVHTAVAVAHAMRSGVTKPIIALENQITLDATIGIAIYPEHGNDTMTLIQQADLTMYDQKRKQRGTIGVFSETLHEKIKNEQRLCEQLRYAIEKKEFSVHYQPIICADTQKLKSVEALLRWNCNGNIVSPARFIPLAERTGLMPEIGSWVLNRACIDATEWPFNEDIALSVNVSISQLLDETFVNALDKVLASTNIDPARLYLEITESVFANNVNAVANQIHNVKQRGVKISIDDFGTGYSSLSRLQSMPCDFIKIDRSFVQNTNEGSDTIMRATMLIANEFGCKTIAEGIETLDQMNHIKTLGVDFIQGFLYAKPMPLSDLKTWYNENK